MVELFEEQIVNQNRKSSKGNQLKWCDGKRWYKADYTGYEGTTEYVISHLIKLSSLGPEEFVIYNPEQIPDNFVEDLIRDARRYLTDQLK